MTILGPPGVGKTRLALALAEQVARRRKTRVTFVDLAPVRDPSLVLEAVAQALGVREVLRQTRIDQLRTELANAPALLVLDNFEQVVEAAGDVGRLLTSCPSLKALATSREPLSLTWERRFPLDTLGLPPREQLEPQRLMRYPAIAFFVARARSVRPDFALTAMNAEAVAQLCLRLDGLPLALELAAPYVDVMPPQQILAGLTQHGLDWLHATHRDRPDRHWTIRLAIDWSHDLLSPEQRTMLRRLSVFAGSFAVEAALALHESGVPSDGSPQGDVAETLSALVRSSLVTTQPAHDETRFRLLETIREYAGERLHASGELGTIEERHARYYMALAEEVEQGLGGSKQSDGVDRLEREHDNLRAALAWAFGPRGLREVGWRLAAALAAFWDLRGHLAIGRRWLETAIATAEAAPKADRANMLMGLGTILWRQGDAVAADHRHRQSLDLYRAIGDVRGMALELNNLGELARESGHPDRARALLEEALPVARHVEASPVLTMVLNNLGLTLQQLGAEEEARAALEEGLRDARRQGNSFFEVSLLTNLAELALQRGDHRTALSLLEDSLGTAERVKARLLLPFSLESAALVCVARGRFAEAMCVLGAVDVERRALGSPRPRDQEELVGRAATVARERLGQRAYSAALSRGRAMSTQDAIQLALGRTELPPEPAQQGSRPRTDMLSRREIDVARLIARGLTNRQIGATLVISEGTAAVHVRHIMDKLEFTSRSQIAAWAVHGGLH